MSDNRAAGKSGDVRNEKPPPSEKPPIDLLGTPVNRALLSMSTPISLGMLSTFLFQVIDTYFVGQLGPAELAALSFATTAFYLLVGIFIGLSAGVSAVIGKSIGESDPIMIRRYAVLALLLSLLLSGAIALAGVLTIAPLFKLLGARPEIVVLIQRYMGLIYPGLPLLAFALVANGMIRATGNVRPPELAMAVAGVINLVLDYLLIFGIGPFPRMELEGAALATVVSWAFVFLISVFMVFRYRLVAVPFRVHQAEQNIQDDQNVQGRNEKQSGTGVFANGWTGVRRALYEILRLSNPSIAAQMLTPATAIFITVLLARSGSEVVAAYGVSSRVELLALIGILSVATALTPFIAQNHGARLATRIDQAIVFAGKASVYVGLLLFVGLRLSSARTRR